jgi:hypothetical protein
MPIKSGFLLGLDLVTLIAIKSPNRTTRHVSLDVLRADDNTTIEYF